MSFDAVLVGLGNPGPSYARTRHNFGFLLADAVLARAGGSPRRVLSGRKDMEALDVGFPGPGGRPLRLLVVKPLTYMNLSGRAAAHVLGYFKLPPEAMVVAHDELDLPLGRARLKRGGGTAGHQGLNSIVAETGSTDFVRLRLGIGRPAPGWEVKNYVLAPFSAAEAELAGKVALAAVEGLSVYFDQGLDAAMRLTNAMNLAAP